MVSTLIVVALFAWGGQVLLTGWQMYRFNRAFSALCQVGEYVGVGRAGGRFRPRVIVAVAFDKQQRVIHSLIIKGATIFASPAIINGIAGLHIDELQPQVIFPHDRNCQNALSLALKLRV